MEEMVTVGFLGLYLGIFGDPVFFIFSSFFYLPYIYPCTETNSNSIATSHKKSCNPTSQVHGFAHEAPPVRFRTDRHVVSLLSCGAVLTIQCKSTLIANVGLDCRVLSTMRMFCQ